MQPDQQQTPEQPTEPVAPQQPDPVPQVEQPPAPAQPLSQQQVPPQQSVQPEPQPAPQQPASQQTVQGYWDPSVDEHANALQPNESASDPLAWEASEYVHHEKTFLWFFLALVVAVALLAVSILLLRSWSFSALIVVLTIGMFVFSRRPPHTVQYQLSAQGIQINDKQLSFHEFRSFGVVQEGGLYAIRLTPNKRFAPMVSVFFPQEYGDAIVDIFGSFLPMQKIEHNFFDRLAEKIRF